MTRRIIRLLKPLGLAVLVLVLAPCVLEFALRVNACRTELQPADKPCDVSVVASWQVHHQLEPLQRIELVCAQASGSPVEEKSEILLPDGSIDAESTSSTSSASTSRSSNDAVMFRTNSLGLRGPEPVVPKPVGVFRIICLGDEGVLAAEVPEEATFCQLLQQRLQAESRITIEVINAGVPDYCPLLSCLQLRHQLIALNPDLVVVSFDMTDVWDDRRFRRLTELGPSEEPLACANPDLLRTPRTRPFSDHFLAWQWAQQKLTRHFRKNANAQPGSSSETPRATYDWLLNDNDDWALQSSVALSAVDHLQHLTEALHARLVLAVHPAPWQISATASAEARRPQRNGIYAGTLFESRRPFELIHEFAVSRNLPLCDAEPSFRRVRSPDDLFQTDTRGLSKDGHRLMAALLEETILRQISGPWTAVSAPALQQVEGSRPASSESTVSQPLPRRVTSNGTGLVPVPGQR